MAPVTRASCPSQTDSIFLDHALMLLNWDATEAHKETGTERADSVVRCVLSCHLQGVGTYSHLEVQLPRTGARQSASMVRKPAQPSWQLCGRTYRVLLLSPSHVYPKTRLTAVMWRFEGGRVARRLQNIDLFKNFGLSHTHRRKGLDRGDPPRQITAYQSLLPDCCILLLCEVMLQNSTSMRKENEGRKRSTSQETC